MPQNLVRACAERVADRLQNLCLAVPGSADERPRLTQHAPREFRGPYMWALARELVDCRRAELPSRASIAMIEAAPPQDERTRWAVG
eukprot:5172234-Prymnesium_polylepis.2